MTVTITSEVFGKTPGQTYTGAMEAWLLANGYASQAAYAGAGVKNTGTTGVAPTNDPRHTGNREAPYFPDTEDRYHPIANAVGAVALPKIPVPDFDLDDAGTNTEAPTVTAFRPKKLGLTGGKVKAQGNNFETITGVTVGGTAGTLVPAESDMDKGIGVFVAPAKAAGTYDVVIQSSTGNTTVVGALTYA